MKNPVSIHILVLLGGLGLAFWQAPRIAALIDRTIDGLWNQNPEFAYRSNSGVTTLDEDLALARAINSGPESGSLDSLEAILDEARESRESGEPVASAAESPADSVSQPAPNAQAPAVVGSAFELSPALAASGAEAPDPASLVRMDEALVSGSRTGFVETAETRVGRAYMDALEGDDKIAQAFSTINAAPVSPPTSDLMLDAGALLADEEGPFLARDETLEDRPIDPAAFSLKTAWAALAGTGAVRTGAQADPTRFSFPANWKLGLRAPPLVIIGPEGSGLADSDESIADAFDGLEADDN